MAGSVSSSGTQTATIGTEHTLKADSVPAAYELHVDTNAMAGGDTLELRLKENVLSGGTVRSAVFFTRSGAAAEAAPNGFIVCLGPFFFDQGVTATLKQTAGTGRAYPWKLLRVGS